MKIFLTCESNSEDNRGSGGSVYFLQAVSRVAGNVLKVHIENNDRITQGQLLVELDPTTYQVA